MIVISPLLLIFLLTACGSPTNKDSAFRIPYTAEEQQFIDEINAIIESVVEPPLTQQNLSDYFFSSGKPPEQAKIIFFGENHVHESSLLEQQRALQMMMQPGDILLFEGNDAGVEVECTDKIFKLYKVKKWNEKNQLYDPEAFKKFGADLIGLWWRTKKSAYAEQTQTTSSSMLFLGQSECL